MNVAGRPPLQSCVSCGKRIPQHMKDGRRSLRCYQCIVTGRQHLSAPTYMRSSRRAERRARRVQWAAVQRRHIPARVREQVIRRDRCCQICGGGERDGDTWTLDHILPLMFGGSDDPSNLRLTHRSCNSARGNRLRAKAAEAARGAAPTL